MVSSVTSSPSRKVALSWIARAPPALTSLIAGTGSPL
jgi:hypothetical protein